MSTLEIICTVLGMLFIVLGLIIYLFQIIGLFKYKYILNRMHAAGMGDTLGLFLSLLGIILLCGFNFTSLKLGLVILFLWFSSPTASHLISKLEVCTNEDVGEHADIQIDKEEDMK